MIWDSGMLVPTLLPLEDQPTRTVGGVLVEGPAASAAGYVPINPAFERLWCIFFKSVMIPTF